MPDPTVGLALIARNEEESLPHLLKSIEGAFDQIVLVDTGSTDRTREVFEDWCKQQEWPDIDSAPDEPGRPWGPSWRVETFKWVDDFAAARAHADSFITTDWVCWADCDDELAGAQNLRALAAQATPELVSFVADYNYAHDQHGNVTCVLKRERLVRRGYGQWVGRVHEAQIFPRGGATTLLDPSVCVWVHRKHAAAADSGERNLRILRAWNDDEADNPRVLGYLGTEEAVAGNYEIAVGYFREYLKLKTGWDEERAQIHRKLAICLLATNKPQDALETALAAFAVIPDWPDTPLTLAEACYQLGEFQKAEKWAREVLRLGMPGSLLILNPLDYTFRPRLVLAGCLGAQGRLEEALAVGQEALGMVPDTAELAAHMGGWRQQLKREQTADSWLAAANILVAHDENLKALRLLEDTVPHYCTDHPRVVQLRSVLRERLLWVTDPAGYAEHYETGGSKPEDGVPDEKITDLCGRLPRARFLKRGIEEQIAA